MSVTASVFLDTGVFIAMLVRRDRYHPQAVELFGRASERWVTSVLVISECYAWFLHRQGEEVARAFREFVRTLKGLTLLAPSLEDHEQTLRMLDRFRGAKLTYVDAASLVWIDRRKIATVWSTDYHLGLTGAEILPRS